MEQPEYVEEYQDYDAQINQDERKVGASDMVTKELKKLTQGQE